VLVHGAWHGAWCWRRVLPLLRGAGVEAHAVTLTGVGERAHLLSPAVDLHTHIQDVVGLIEAEELQRIVLVGHSYAGVVVTGVADRLQRERPGTLAHLVYLDAAVPSPGDSWSSHHSAETKQARTDASKPSGGLSFPPPDASLFGLEGADRDWVNRRQTPQPFRLYQQPLDFDGERVARPGARAARTRLAGAGAGHRARPDGQRTPGPGRDAAGHPPRVRLRASPWHSASTASTCCARRPCCG
jgi:pimeloyl-ACP methyl ester carboxylesterase